MLARLARSPWRWSGSCRLVAGVGHVSIQFDFEFGLTIALAVEFRLLARTDCSNSLLRSCCGQGRQQPVLTIAVL